MALLIWTKRLPRTGGMTLLFSALAFVVRASNCTELDNGHKKNTRTERDFLTYIGLLVTVY